MIMILLPIVFNARSRWMAESELVRELVERAGETKGYRQRFEAFEFVLVLVASRSSRVVCMRPLDGVCRLMIS